MNLVQVIDLFTNIVSILNCIISNSYYGILANLHPEHLIIAVLAGDHMVSNMTAKVRAKSLTFTFHFGPFVLKIRLNFVNFPVPRRISRGTG